MRQEKKLIRRLWFRAKLTALANSIFTPGFYPPKNRLGNRYVFFTQVDSTPSTHKVVVASRLNENSLRLMTLDLAEKCLIPGKKATKAQMSILNEVSKNLKL